MRAFRLGDSVAIGSAEGEVVARNLLVTRLRTIQNEDITLSNAAGLGGTVTNYTFAEDSLPVAARTAVTLGYDVPWRTAHALLLQAAAATPEVLVEPAPFVLQRSLDDFYVRYELSAHIPDPRRLRFVLSDLHGAIQDAFAAAGVEICSPHHAALRDGNSAAIPGAGPVPPERSFRVRNG
jgi:small-conductance mechanosensitive channel